MSDSETTGRCRKQIEESYAHNRNCVPRYAWITADAIDRLAADVAAIKEAVCAVSPEDVRHFVDSEKAWVKLVEDQRDAAVRERNEARALLELAQVQRAAAYADRDEARAEVYQLKCSRTETSKERDAAIRERDQWREEARLAVINRDEARAEVERLKAIVHSDNGHMAKILIENERLRAELAAPQPAAPAAGWLTEREQHALRHILAADVEPAIRSILSRAGSPPVVEVPELPSNHYARSEAERYRAAIDKAGVAWKEVGRE